MQTFSRLLLYEDNHLCLVHKPAGMPTQRDSSQDICLLDHGKNYLKQRYCKLGNAYLSLVHRLDRPVAGLCVLAKTTKAMQRLSKAFQNHSVQKYYIAIIEGKEAPSLFCWSELRHYLRKNSSQNKSYLCKETDSGAKLAQLKYCTVAKSKDYSIVVVHLKTGRHHQIRCQLAAIGHPIRGDLKYGAKHANTNKGINLCAFALKLPMPVAKDSEYQQKYVSIAQNQLSAVYLPWQVTVAPEESTIWETIIWESCQKSQIMDFLEHILE